MLNDLGGARLAKFRSVAQKGAHEFIPSSCIWAKETFSTWLASENEGRDLWEESVFPQMKNILNEVTNDSFEEEPNLRKNTFELFGADFMIDEKLNVFLLEINKSPDPAANTKIQRRLFEGIASDTIKVNFIIIFHEIS
jgi:tubulin monoglycylase TTLL3/8